MLVPIQNESISPIFNLQQYVERYISECDIKQNSKITYRRQLYIFFEWLQNQDAIAISQAEILKYKEYLLVNSKSVYTVNSYLTVLKSFFAWLDASKIYPNIARKIKNLKTPYGYNKECLTPEQVRIVLSTFDTTTIEGMRDFALFNLLVRTGLRASEIINLVVGDLCQKGGQQILWIQGKGRHCKDNFVILTNDTIYPIKRYLELRNITSENDPLFASISNRSAGKPIKDRTIRGIIKSAFRKIGLNSSKITTHSLRHTAITLCIKGGATLLQAQTMARHSDPKTTLIYVHEIERIESGAEHLIQI